MGFVSRSTASLPPESSRHLGPQFGGGGAGSMLNRMASEGRLCANQQHGLIHDLGVGLVRSVMPCRVLSYGGVGINSKLPPRISLYALTMHQARPQHLAPDV